MKDTVCDAPAAHAGETTDAMLRVTDLSLAYGGVPALRGVSLTVRRGAVTALVGPSGCGKSSFLMSLNRLTDLVPGCTVTGSIRLDDGEVLDPRRDVPALRRRIGMIFQKPNPFPFSIAKNITTAAQAHGLRDKKALADLVEAVLRDVGLWDEVCDRLDAPATALSGGQQQRLCLARALALKPEVLLLDEPCSALDPLAADVVEQHIAALRGRFTVVVVTHNLAQARRLADDTAVFWVVDGAGALVESGPTQALFDAPRHELTRAYLSGRRG